MYQEMDMGYLDECFSIFIQKVWSWYTKSMSRSSYK